MQGTENAKQKYEIKNVKARKQDEETMRERKRVNKVR